MASVSDNYLQSGDRRMDVGPCRITGQQSDTCLFDSIRDQVVFGNGAFHDPAEMDYLRKPRNIHVWARHRKDSRTPWPAEFRRFAARLRLRVETALSVLVTVFNIERPGSRSLSGCIARVATRMLAYSLAFITRPLLAQLC